MLKITKNNLTKPSETEPEFKKPLPVTKTKKIKKKKSNLALGKKKRKIETPKSNPSKKLRSSDESASEHPSIELGKRNCELNFFPLIQRLEESLGIHQLVKDISSSKDISLQEQCTLPELTEKVTKALEFYSSALKKYFFPSLEAHQQQYLQDNVTLFENALKSIGQIQEGKNPTNLKSLLPSNEHSSISLKERKCEPGCKKCADIDTVPNKPTFTYLQKLEQDLLYKKLDPSSLQKYTIAEAKEITKEGLEFYNRILQDRAFYNQLEAYQQQYFKEKQEKFQKGLERLEAADKKPVQNPADEEEIIIID